tara:strand:+ start:514 stop:633 length:120 start_codon:yes stop_codon:yes gene_type:complete
MKYFHTLVFIDYGMQQSDIKTIGNVRLDNYDEFCVVDID